MKEHLLAFLAALISTTPYGLAQAPETLTQQERNFAMSHLNATRKRFHDSLASLSKAQWNFKPAPDRWSIAECAEHIAVSEDFLFGLLTEEFMKSPVAPPGKRVATKENDEKVLQFSTDRSQKAQAPDPLRPSGRFATAAEVLRAFNQSRDRTVAYIENTQEDLRSHVMPFDTIQAIDAYQLVLLISGHSSRHTAQIDEVKAAPNYPKK